jgi:APA family basic amino acid/polyamine antiporter
MTDAPVSSDARLKPGVTLLGVVMFGAGTAIGVSVFSVLGPAARVAGSGLLVSVLLAALPMVLFAVVYGFLASVLPKSGASYEWPARFVHPLFGFLVAWLRILGSVGVVATLLAVLVNYLGMAFDLPALPVKLGVLTAIFGLNFVGVSVAARAQALMMAVLLASMALFVAGGAPLVRIDNLVPLTAAGWPAIAAAVPLMITLFLGIESATEIGEEVRDARRTIPRGIALAIGLTAVVYLAVAVVALGVLGPERLAASKAPLLEAARVPLGARALPVIVGAAVFAVVKTLNSSALIFSRYLFAMGRAGVLPAALGRVHARFGTPHVALLAAYLAALAGLLLPSTLVFLLLAVNIPTMLKYLGSCLAAIRLVQRHPELHAQAALPLARGTVTTIATLGVLAAIAIIVAGLGADWRPYALVGAWGLVGLVYWFVVPRTAARASA